MDGRRFDDLTRTLAASATRRRFLGGLGAAVAALVAHGGGDGAEARQAACGNVVCARNPSKCAAGCVCCAYANARGRIINSRCRPPGTCGPGTVACPDGERYCEDPRRCAGCCGDGDCAGGVCRDGDCCQPRLTCASGECGVVPDGCGGELDCGPCCVPDCGGRTCGDDGCGDSCGACASCTTCGSGGTCEPRVCAGAGQCSAETCDPELDACVSRPIDTGSACDEGDVCTTGSTCQADGTCGGGGPVICNTPPECGRLPGFCDRSVGGCLYTQQPLGQPCNGGAGRCAGTVCVACITSGNSVNPASSVGLCCSNACTSDPQQPERGCVCN